VLLALDVQYAPDAALTGAVGFVAWTDGAPAFEHVVSSQGAPAPYEPGAFYRRELPYLLAALAEIERTHRVEIAVIDGHAWLGTGRPGLGARLFRALGERIPVVGVAKSAFTGGNAIAVLRGASRNPLHVSAAGMDAREAAALVRDMHGPHRLPTLLRRADQLARGEPPDPRARLSPP
jgi:deoxyribonuclease V